MRRHGKHWGESRWQFDPWTSEMQHENSIQGISLGVVLYGVSRPGTNPATSIWKTWHLPLRVGPVNVVGLMGSR